VDKWFIQIYLNVSLILQIWTTLDNLLVRLVSIHHWSTSIVIQSLGDN
jgi:hypothetical protein